MASPQGAPIALTLGTPGTPALAPTTNHATPSPARPPSPTGGRKRTAAEAFGSSPALTPAEVMMEEGEDEDCDDNETVGSGTPPPDGINESQLSAATAAPPAKKKRKDVSPNKYFEVCFNSIAVNSERELGVFPPAKKKRKMCRQINILWYVQ